jgi:L-iditol 2-dehydrogenase
MKALYLDEPRRLRLAEVAAPEPGDGDVLIRVKAATTCGTDLKAFRRGHAQIPMPGPFGHEYSGIVEVSRNPKFEVGQAVMGVHSAPCHRCAWCLRDQENLCESIMATKVLGAYAELLLVPKRVADLNLFEKPANLPFSEAALLEPLACVAEGLRHVRLEPGLNALVIGPGAIGLMFVAAMRAEGVESVTLAGRNRDRLAVGEGFGATPVAFEEVSGCASTQPMGGFDLVIECTGMVEVWELTPNLARRGGEVILFGGPPGGSQAAFDTSRLHYDQIALLSPFHFGTEAVRQAYQWLTSRRVKLASLLSGERRLEEFEEVFGDLEAGRGLKYVFRP